MRALYIGSIGLVSSVGHGYHVVFLGFNTSLSQSPFHPRLNPELLRVTGKLSRKTDIKLGGGGGGPRGGGQPVIKKNILLRKGVMLFIAFLPQCPSPLKIQPMSMKGTGNLLWKLYELS